MQLTAILITFSLYAMLVVPAAGLLKDVTKLSCTFDTSLCGWSSTSVTPGQQTFVRTQPTPGYGPPVDYNTNSVNGK